MELRRLVLRFLSVSFLLVFFGLSSLAWTRMALAARGKVLPAHSPTTLVAQQ